MNHHQSAMNLQSLSDVELNAQTVTLVQQERLLVSEILDHLRENEARRLYAKLGYSSLYAYCTGELGYCPASAQLRIDAMRLSKEIPEVKEALVEGRVTLTSVGLLQSFARKKKPSLQEKTHLFHQIEHQSKAQTERLLASLAPELFQEKTRVISQTETEIRFVAQESLIEMIEELKARMRTQGILHPTYAEIFEYAMRRALKIKEVRRSAAASSAEVKRASSDEVKAAGLEAQPVAGAQRTVTSSAEVKKAPRSHRPHIPAAVIRQLKAETRQCTYRSPLTGKRCEQSHGLQIEHCNPYAMGGGDELENLTLLCATHNQLRALQTYGPAKLQPA